MEVTINNQKHILHDACSIGQMLTSISAAANGLAIAVNQNIISKPDWETHFLKAGDQVMLIKATQGG